MTLVSPGPLDRKSLSQAIFKTCYLQGRFKLRSGQVSSEYFDKYRFEAQPHLLRAIAAHMKALIPQGTKVLAGLEMGGIPIATALSLETGLPLVFVRKKAKDYGTEKFAEGLEIQGKRVLVIEDVVTTGGQILLSTEDLRKNGAVISDALCVILRGEDLSAFEKSRLRLHPLFTMQELKTAGTT
ncbi:MAG: orotate phosphoribosyltransferase [Bdellovibrionales bacterium]